MSGILSRAVGKISGRVPFALICGPASRLPHSVLEAYQRALFAQTVRWVSDRAPFYQEAFRSRGIRAGRVRAPQDLGDFTTSAEDLRSHPSSAFLCQEPDTAFETTATSGKRPKRVYFSDAEIRMTGRMGALGLWALGVRRKDRVVSAFDYSFWNSGPTLKASLKEIGCFHVEAGKLDPKEFYERVRDYGCNVIVGEPSWLVRLAEVAAQRGPWSVKLILCGGENIAEDQRAFVESVWKAPVVLSYGQTESFGVSGTECLARKGYHLNEVDYLFEIVNPDPQGYGELVYTTLRRQVFPLVRYRSGDVTRFLPGKCSCPLISQRVEKIQGRTDEIVCCGMGNLSPWMFEQLFSGLSDISQEWQVGIRRDTIRDIVELRLELTDGVDGRKGVEEAVRQRLQEDFSDYWRNHDLGLYELRFAFLPKGGLRKGRKLRRIVDERKFS